MAQESSSKRSSVSSPCPKSPNAIHDSYNFSEASESLVAWLAHHHPQTSDSLINASRPDTPPPSPTSDDSFSDGGVPLSADASGTSSSSGGVYVSESTLDLLMSQQDGDMAASAASQDDSSNNDTFHDAQSSPDPPSSTGYFTTSIGASSSDFVVFLERSSSDSGSWASGEHSLTWDTFQEFHRNLMRRPWNSPPPPLYAVPSLTEDETPSSSSSTLSVDGSAGPSVVEYMEHLPLELEDETFWDEQPVATVGHEPSLANHSDEDDS